MEYTLFQDFARKIPRPAPPTGHPDAPSQAVHWNLATGPHVPWCLSVCRYYVAKAREKAEVDEGSEADNSENPEGSSKCLS